MIEYYAQIRYAHILAAALSGGVFALRGIGVLAGARWPMHAAVRYASYTIDTALLTAALMLVAILPSVLFANHWLGLKLALLVAYVVLGSFALKRATTRRGKLFCYLAALLVFALIVGVARAHHPLGWFLGPVRPS